MKKALDLSVPMFSVLLFSLFILFIATFSCFAETGCPDKTFICPLGEQIPICLCWNRDSLSCQMCRSIEDEVDSKCNHPHCTEEWIGHSDGCSAPGISEGMTRVFGAACYIHDLCYSSAGRPKSDCDREFLSNMLEICSFPGVPATLGGEACEAAAQIAYQAVVEFGQNAYDQDQTWAQNHCSENPLPDACDDRDNDGGGEADEHFRP